MTIHYHGSPINPETCALRAWAGRHAFISWIDPTQLGLAASVTQSFALDNGAFSKWRAGLSVDWNDYYRWTERWLSHPACDWAIIPDVIDGTEDENDALVDAWPHGPHAGVPVWHLNESIDRLVRLCDGPHPRIALGSAAEYDVSSPSRCLPRLAEACAAIAGPDGRPRRKLHGLRMLNPTIIEAVPLASADSTNVARNIGIDQAWTGPYAPSTKEARVDILVARIEQAQSPDRMHPRWAEARPPLSLFDHDLSGGR